MQDRAIANPFDDFFNGRVIFVLRCHAHVIESVVSTKRDSFGAVHGAKFGTAWQLLLEDRSNAGNAAHFKFWFHKMTT